MPKRVFAQTKQKSFFQKGFIGPIGDDLPSLVPIVVALVMFFSVFAFTLSVFNLKNSLVDEGTSMTTVARDLKGDSLVPGVASFAKNCEAEKLKKFGYNFAVAMYPSERSNEDTMGFMASAMSDPSTLANTNFFRQTVDGAPKYFFCSYQKLGGLMFTGREKTLASYYYPVAVQMDVVDERGNTQSLVVPGIMSMVMWK